MMITILAFNMPCCMRISVKFTRCRKKREIWFCRMRIDRKSYVSMHAQLLRSMPICQAHCTYFNLPCTHFEFNSHRTVHCTHGCVEVNAFISPAAAQRQCQWQQLIFGLDECGLFSSQKHTIPIASTDICELAFHFEWITTTTAITFIRRKWMFCTAHDLR